MNASVLLAAIGLFVVTTVTSNVRAEDTAPPTPPGAAFTDELTRALFRVPGLGAMLEPMFHPSSPAPQVPLGPTIRIAPMFSSNTIGIRAVGTF